MKFNGDFIGHNIVSTTTEWTVGDSIEQYNENIMSQPDDWYYRNRTITYSFNQYGHRSKEIIDVDLENYILFLGCSHTEGVGLELETTYPYLISKQLGCDYYNLGLAATGIDVVEYNLLTWFAKVNNKPKAVVIQWPDHSRFISHNPEYENLIERCSWSNDDHTGKFILNAETSGLAAARKQLIAKLVENVVKVPTIQCVFTSHPSFNRYNLYLRKIDKARDLAHAGLKSHQAWSELLLEELAKA